MAYCAQDPEGPALAVVLARGLALSGIRDSQAGTHGRTPVAIMRRFPSSFLNRSLCSCLAAGIVACSSATMLGGCAVSSLATADRYANGLVVILPGIEGRSVYNVSIARGLDGGNVPSAIEIFDWGVATPGGFLVNLTALERNKRQAQKLARRISYYQASFPGRPIHLFAHSGGGGIALLALEAMEPGKEISAAYLLGAAVSPDYDLTDALEHTKLGIWNFYSPSDVSFLTVGTSMFGTMDRRHTSSAGAIGFRVPESLDPQSLDLYTNKLHQAPHSRKMAKAGSSGSHFGWANQRFVRSWLAPMVLADMRAVALPHYARSALVRADSPDVTSLSD